MTRKIIMQGYLLTVLLFFVMPAYSAQNIRIEIPEIIYSDNDSFTLGQIAKITGGVIRTRRILASVQVFADGGRLSRNEVLRAINDSDASDARIELYMPLYSRIEAPDYEGNFTETIEDSSSRTLNDLVPLIKSLSAWDGDIEISANSPVPDGKLIDPASIVPGTSAANLRFRDDSGRVKSLSVRLTWLQNVMIASHNINRGDRISPRDLISREIKVTRPGVYASSPGEISGFTANKNIKQGEAIILSNLTSSNVVKKGRPVKIIARYGAASASADGVLLEDGKPGDWVKVRRIDDRKITLRAQIINENTVEVRVE